MKREGGGEGGREGGREGGGWRKGGALASAMSWLHH